MVTKLSTPTEQTSLPAGWRWAQLGDVCTVTETRDPRREPDTTFKYVDITSVDNTSKKITAAREILGKDAPSRARQVIHADDVIVSTTRPNLNAVAIVAPELDNQICSTGFCVLRAMNELDAQFLFAFVQTPEFVIELSESVKGALYPAVTDAQVRGVALPLPSLPEQHRIAARLNAMMADIARARASAQAALDAANALPTALLRDVFESDEAKGWERKRLGDLVEFKNGINFDASQKGSGILTVDVFNMYSDSLVLKMDKLYRVDKQLNEDYLLRVNDILFVRSSVKKEGVGWSALFPGYTEPVTFCGFLIRARLNQGQIYPEFLLYYLRQSSIREWFASTAGQVAITNISQEKLRDISVPVPSTSTQREISSRLEVKTRATYQAVAAVQSQLGAINGLPDAYLRRAFRGEL